MDLAEEVVKLLKSQHLWANIPVMFSPDQVRKAINDYHKHVGGEEMSEMQQAHAHPPKR